MLKRAMLRKPAADRIELDGLKMQLAQAQALNADLISVRNQGLSDVQYDHLKPLWRRFANAEIPDLATYRWLACTGEPMTWEGKLYEASSEWTWAVLACAAGLGLLGVLMHVWVLGLVPLLPLGAYAGLRRKQRRTAVKTGHYDGIVAEIHAWTALNEELWVATPYDLPTSRELNLRMAACTAHVFVLPDGVGVRMDLPENLQALGPRALGFVRRDVAIVSAQLRVYQGDLAESSWAEDPDIYLRTDGPGASLVLIKHLDGFQRRPDRIER